MIGININQNIISIFKKNIYTSKNESLLKFNKISFIINKKISKDNIKKLLEIYFPIKIKKINSLIIKKNKKIIKINNKKKYIKNYKKSYKKIYLTLVKHN